METDPNLGRLTGNPRVRNRSTLLGKLQVAEFSSIIGLIKRSQSISGMLFTLSGVILLETFAKLLFPNSRNPNTGFQLFPPPIPPDFTQMPPSSSPDAP